MDISIATEIRRIATLHGTHEPMSGDRYPIPLDSPAAACGDIEVWCSQARGAGGSSLPGVLRITALDRGNGGALCVYDVSPSGDLHYVRGARLEA